MRAALDIRHYSLDLPHLPPAFRTFLQQRPVRAGGGAEIVSAARAFPDAVPTPALDRPSGGEGKGGQGPDAAEQREEPVRCTDASVQLRDVTVPRPLGAPSQRPPPHIVRSVMLDIRIVPE